MDKDENVKNSIIKVNLETEIGHDILVYSNKFYKDTKYSLCGYYKNKYCDEELCLHPPIGESVIYYNDKIMKVRYVQEDTVVGTSVSATKYSSIEIALGSASAF